MGDNDTLSALVAAAVEADALLIMSNVPGIVNPSTGIIEKMINPRERPEKYDSGTKTPAGVGGIVTKFRAARIAASHGIPTYVGDGRDKTFIQSFLEGAFRGTVFPPEDRGLRGKKRWIAILQKPRGTIVVDAGAAEALRARGKSLLPRGVTGVRGSFSRGDVVEIFTEDGHLVGRGITAYSAQELRKIQGCRTSEIESILGYRYSDEVIHRDEMIVER